MKVCRGLTKMLRGGGRSGDSREQAGGNLVDLRRPHPAEGAGAVRCSDRTRSPVMAEARSPSAKRKTKVEPGYALGTVFEGAAWRCRAAICC